jgi:hypothetical protein
VTFLVVLRSGVDCHDGYHYRDFQPTFRNRFCSGGKVVHADRSQEAQVLFPSYLLRVPSRRLLLDKLRTVPIPYSEILNTNGDSTTFVQDWLVTGVLPRVWPVVANFFRSWQIDESVVDFKDRRKEHQSTRTWNGKPASATVRSLES